MSRARGLLRRLPLPVKTAGAMALWQVSRLTQRLDGQWSRLRNIRKGQTCVIVGNGPSLRSTDLRLASSVDTFGLNRLYLVSAELGLAPNWFAVVNDLLLDQFANEIEDVEAELFVPARHRRKFSRTARIHFFTQRPDGRFSTDLADGVTAGGTVTAVAMQIAYHLGYARVLLVGVDHRYAHQGTPNEELVADAPDVNHVSSDYFGPGIRWNAPDLVASEASYRQARTAFEADGREIVDCTVDGALTIFRRSTLENELSR